MKRIFCLTIALLLGISGAVYALTVVGSKHDMRLFITDETTTQVCVFCHTPHGGTPSGAPLWSHRTSEAIYALYTSSTIQGDVTQPSSVSVSRACLSCHDGTVAVNSLTVLPRDGGVGTETFIRSGTPAYVGTDLRLLNPTHPVSITYRPDLDPGLRQNQGNTVVSGAITLPLYGNVSPYSVECGSCHDVHNPAYGFFLRVANTSDQLCLTCHPK